MGPSFLGSRNSVIVFAIAVAASFAGIVAFFVTAHNTDSDTLRVGLSVGGGICVVLLVASLILLVHSALRPRKHGHPASHTVPLDNQERQPKQGFSSTGDRPFGDDRWSGEPATVSPIDELRESGDETHTYGNAPADVTSQRTSYNPTLQQKRGSMLVTER